MVENSKTFTLCLINLPKATRLLLRPRRMESLVLVRKSGGRLLEDVSSFSLLWPPSFREAQLRAGLTTSGAKVAEVNLVIVGSPEDARHLWSSILVLVFEANGLKANSSPKSEVIPVTKEKIIQTWAA